MRTSNDRRVFEKNPDGAEARGVWQVGLHHGRGQVREDGHRAGHTLQRGRHYVNADLAPPARSSSGARPSSHELSTWAKSRHITEHDDVTSCQDGITSSCMGVHFASSILVTSTASSKARPAIEPLVGGSGPRRKACTLCRRAPFALPLTQWPAAFHC